MHINIQAIYPATYLNMVSQIMKELNLHGLVDQLVPVDAQCQTRPSDIVQLIILDILSVRQALVHLESWAAQIDLEKLIRSGLTANQLNDDAIGRHLDRLHEAGIHEIVSSFLLRTYRIEKLPINCFHLTFRTPLDKIRMIFQALVLLGSLSKLAIIKIGPMLRIFAKMAIFRLKLRVSLAGKSIFIYLYFVWNSHKPSRTKG